MHRGHAHPACGSLVQVGGHVSSTRLIVTFDRDDYLVDGLRAGASGFLLKNAEPEKLVDAVRVVGNGHALLGARKACSK